MASAVTSAPALSKQDIILLSEALIKSGFMNPAIGEFHNVIPGIKGSKRLAALGQLSGLAGFVKSDCDITAASLSAEIIDKTWAPAYVSDRAEQCYEDLMGSFFQWGLKNNLAKEDLTGTEFQVWFETIMAKLIEEIVLRVAWFGDTAMVAGTNNSISAGNVKYFSMINGLWKQLAALNGGASFITDLATKNAQVTFALQRFNSTDTTNRVVTNALDNLFYAADLRLRDMDRSQLIFIVTQSVKDQYEKERKAVTGIDLPYQRQEAGVNNLASNGIEVKSFSFLDRTIDAHYRINAGASWYLPHRIILTHRDNLYIGVEEESSLANFDSFFDRYNKKQITDFGFSMDAKVALDIMAAVAY